MPGRVRRFICLFLLAAFATGCVGISQPVTEVPNPMPTETYVSQEAIQETTKLRLADGWEIVLQMVYQGEYTDDAGRTVTGPKARISVWDRQKPQADTLEVRVGSVIDAGKQYRVLELKEGRGGSAPGTADGYMVIGQLP